MRGQLCLTGAGRCTALRSIKTGRNAVTIVISP